MARKNPSPKSALRASRGRRLVRSLAQGTVLAAGIAATHLTPEIDPRFHLFTPGLLDRLNPPITRYHE